MGDQLPLFKDRNKLSEKQQRAERVRLMGVVRDRLFDPFRHTQKERVLHLLLKQRETAGVLGNDDHAWVSAQTFLEAYLKDYAQIVSVLRLQLGFKIGKRKREGKHYFEYVLLEGDVEA